MSKKSTKKSTSKKVLKKKSVENKKDYYFKDGASGEIWKTKDEAFKKKGVGFDKGTKYSITIDRVLEKVNSKAKVISLVFGDIFSEKKVNKKYFIKPSIRNSVYVSEKFRDSEILDFLKLRGIYRINKEKSVVKTVPKDNSLDSTSGLISLVLEKI